jgi:hypothetical protein
LFFARRASAIVAADIVALAPFLTRLDRGNMASKEKAKGKPGFLDRVSIQDYACAPA